MCVCVGVCVSQMAKLPPEVLKRGVITSSAGNHAQGVSLAAARMVSINSHAHGLQHHAVIPAYIGCHPTLITSQLQ